MIDFRYHIVSIMAVFLALGLGILLGSSVVSDAVEAQLADDLRAAREQRIEARAERDAATKESKDLRELIGRQIAPWTVDGRLDGRRSIVFADGDVSDWESHVTRALESAGAENVGTVSFTEKWGLASPADEDELIRAMESAGADFVATADAAAAALTALGESFLQPGGELLVDALDEAGFLAVRGRPDEGAWPPASSVVVILSAARSGEEEPTPGVASFARAVSDAGPPDGDRAQRRAAPTLVASDTGIGRSVLTELRQQRDADDVPPLSPLLATFDAATDELDPGGIGVVAAMAAAAQEVGGDFGLDPSVDRFLPELGSPE